MLATGVSASPGAAKGEIVFTAAEAVEAEAGGRDVILVRPFTEADDVAGFHAARGILTSRGREGVARGARRPRHGPARASCGASDLEIDLAAELVRVSGTELHAGDRIAIDGTTGADHDRRRAAGRARRSPSTSRRVLAWADELRRARRAHERRHARGRGQGPRVRRRGHRPVPHRAHVLRRGAREPIMQRMILAAGEDERRAALDELRPLQQADFEGLFEAMAGLPVTIRLLDPPLHEFLPQEMEVVERLERARIEQTDDLDDLERLYERVEQLHGGQPDARHPRRAGSGSCTRRSTRCRYEAIFARRARRARAYGGGAAPGADDPARRLRARAGAHARARLRGGRAARARPRATTSWSAR